MTGISPNHYRSQLLVRAQTAPGRVARMEAVGGPFHVGDLADQRRFGPADAACMPFRDGPANGLVAAFEQAQPREEVVQHGGGEPGADECRA